MNHLRLLLVTDNSLLAEGIASMLRQHDEIAVAVITAEKKSIIKYHSVD